MYIRERFNVWLLGIAIVIGGQYVGWNEGMDHGIFLNLLCFGCISVAYTTLCCCTAEISGALPFAGGAYGLTRCTLGFFPAFLIGCCEALEYIAYVAASVMLLADLIIQAIPSLEHFDPLVWLLFYLSAFLLLSRDNVFWTCTTLLGIVSIGIVLVFCVGSLPYVDFNKFARQQNLDDFQGGFKGFMKVLPFSIWFYVGVEALNLVNDQVKEPRHMVPKAQIACVITLFTTGLMVFFVSVSLPPGVSSLGSSLAPFNRGFTVMTGASAHVASLFSLPATFATSFGFTWCYGKLIAAMANSGLLPARLGTRSRAGSSASCCSSSGLMLGSVLSFSLCLLQLFYKSAADSLFMMCVMSASMSYTGQCLGYISLRFSYKSIKSSYFQNPFGIAGAVVSMVIWLLVFIASAFFQTKYDFTIFVGVLGSLALYYFLYAKHRQIFSAEENRVLLVAHIFKVNKRRQENNHHRVPRFSFLSGFGTSKSKQTESTSTSSFQQCSRQDRYVVTSSVSSTVEAKYKSDHLKTSRVQPLVRESPN